MWTALKCMLFSCIVLLCFSSVSASETISLELSPVSSEGILSCESAESLDSLLYPSGIEIPTKYLDASSLLFTATSLDVNVETYNWLRSNFPADTYTFAEIYAADMYLYLDKCFQEDTLSGDQFAAQTFYESCGISSNIAGYTVEITDWDLFKTYIDSALIFEEETLQSALYENSCVSVGMGFDWFSEFDLYTRDSVQFFFDTRQTFMQSTGLAFAYSSSELANREKPVLADNTAENTDISVVDKTADLDLDTTAPDTVLPQTEPSTEIDYNSVRANSSISDFALVEQSGLTQGSIGFHDVIIVVAIIIASAAAIVFCILDWLRKRRDPTRRYKR